MFLFGRKSEWRFNRQHPKICSASLFLTRLFLFLLLLFLVLFEPYMNPLSIVRLKVGLPSFLQSSDGKSAAGESSSTPNMSFIFPGERIRAICNTTNPLTDVCEMEGDVRIKGKEVTVELYVTDGGGASWRIRPFPRKGDPVAMNLTREIRVREVSRHSLTCQVRHRHPAVVFATAGYLGNLYHDMTDALLPLFLTAHRFSGDVHFLVTNYKPLWVRRFKDVLPELTKHPIVNLEADDRVHCFPGATVGLTRHGEFLADQSLPPGRLSTKDFTAFLRSSLHLPRSAVTRPALPAHRPRLLLLSRKTSRRFLNVPSIVTVARDVGFEVVIEEGRDVTSFARIVNSCDVIVGVHGAGLTNMAFLPEGAVVVQVMPLGGLSDWVSMLCFGHPAKEMGIRHIKYEIEVDESSLLDVYPRNHTVFTNPTLFNLHHGWMGYAEIYLYKQNVRLNVTRFRGVLHQALDLLTN